MKAEIKNGNLIVTIELSEKVSSTGKSILIASTGSNTKTDLVYKKLPVSVQLNAYIPNKE